MEFKEAEGIVIAKPVPSRPTTYNFRSFSELLAGAINTSPSNACLENPVSPIRPKTVRFTVNNAFAVETSVDVFCGPSANLDKNMELKSKSTVVYKPLAKVVSKTIFSSLANLGNSNPSHQKATTHVEANIQPPNHCNYNFRSDLNQHVSSSQTRTAKVAELPNKTPTAAEGEKDIPPTAIIDRTSYDGYNWRKYGQKQVKGSEYPRSYYKCTHPNCPVKKKVERSLDGQIAEIVYKGEHNHSKPQAPKKNTSSSQGHGFVSNTFCQNSEKNHENSEGKNENQNLVGSFANSSFSGKGALSYDPAVICTPEKSYGVQRECGELEDDPPQTKKRKVENEAAGRSGEGVEAPHPTVLNPPADSDVIGDGFRWRKYGQKVVKGNPYPRSYYRCTNLKCNVRKHVERAMDDPTSFITTYEGKHNHDMPNKPPNITPLESDP